VERDIRRPPTAGRIERNGEGCRLKEQPTPMQWIWRRVERRSRVTCRSKWAQGLSGQGRSHWTAVGLKRARYGTSRLRDQENVSYPVSLSPEGPLLGAAVPAGLGAPFLLGPGCTEGGVLLLARLLERPAVR
jgi:hypothetical protein